MNTLSKDVISKIKRNISHNNIRDTKKYGTKGTLTYNEFMDMIKEQGNKCYICLQDFQYNGGQWCYFFPSPDRIHNYSPHSKENVGVSCIFCNIRTFKQISEKKCGLCEGLEHTFIGDIITKASLFRSLGNNKYRIKEFIKTMNNSEEMPG